MAQPISYKNYGGTITFAGHWTDTERKLKCITKIFPTIFPQYIPDYYKAKLKFTIEYHKVEQEDDPDAPHAHFILSTLKPINQGALQNILYHLQRTIGRSQLYYLTPKKYTSYSQYILKDVKTNEHKYKFPHYYEQLLFKEEPKEQLKDETYVYEYYEPYYEPENQGTLLSSYIEEDIL